MPSPCARVHLRMGEPPPMARYCSSILGVRRLAMYGAMVDWKGRGMRSARFEGRQLSIQRHYRRGRTGVMEKAREEVASLGDLERGGRSA